MGRVSHLDAFSGYLRATSLPGAAPGGTARTRAVASSRSSRTRDDVPQHSHAHDGYRPNCLTTLPATSPAATWWWGRIGRVRHRPGSKRSSGPRRTWLSVGSSPSSSTRLTSRTSRRCRRVIRRRPYRPSLGARTRCYPGSIIPQVREGPRSNRVLRVPRLRAFACSRDARRPLDPSAAGAHRRGTRQDLRLQVLVA